MVEASKIESRPQPPGIPFHELLDFMSITRALADENRVRIVMALQGGELCVCQIVELLQLAPSTVSKHVSILRQARLVRTLKDGRWVYYSLDTDSNRLSSPLLFWMKEALRNVPEVAADRERLRKILRMEPQMLCRVQKGQTGAQA